jgi:hypothetical protein
MHHLPIANPLSRRVTTAIGIVLAALTLTVTLLPGRAQAATGAYTVNVAAAVCWTTFNPPSPQGAAMDQTYRNCNSQGIDVAAGYSYQGQVHLGFPCRHVAPGGQTIFHWPSTQRGAQYTTVVCKYPA